MSPAFQKQALLFFLAALGLEAASYLAYGAPFFVLPLFLLAVALFGLACLRSLPLAASLVFLELFIGSKGHLLSLAPLGVPVSLRMAFFIVFFIASAPAAWKYLLKLEKKLLYPLLGLFFFLAVGLALGIWKNGLAELFFDINGYFYFALAAGVGAAFWKRESLALLMAAFVGAMSWLFLKTYLLLFVLSHSIATLSEPLYRWVRVTGAAEPTRIAEGAYRVFFQSHIWALAGFLVFLVLLALGRKYEKRGWLGLAMSTICLAMVLVSFSRSLWAAATALLFFLATYWLIFRRDKAVLARGVKYLGLSLALSLLVIYANLSLPVEKFLPSGAFVSGELVRKRLTGLGEEAAASSRWSQLGPLFEGIKKSPLLGHGFGKSLVYTSSDPRVLESDPTGRYRTYAFEWGYLDMLLKMGVFGLASYLWLAGAILRKLYRQGRVDSFLAAVSLLAVAATHVFTPYLNHPLGIGAVLLALAVASQGPERQPAPDGSHAQTGLPTA